MVRRFEHKDVVGVCRPRRIHAYRVRGDASTMERKVSYLCEQHRQEAEASFRRTGVRMVPIAFTYENSDLPCRLCASEDDEGEYHEGWEDDTR